MSTAPPQPSAITSLVRSNRLRLLGDAGIVAVVVVTISVLVRIAWPGFSYYGDNANSFFPLWHIFGEGLRNGQFLLFDHNGWSGAPVVSEAAYGLFNPVTMANAVVISLFDNLSHASFLVMTEFLAIMGIGVYMLARVYGASRGASLIVAIIVPFGGYTLFYEAGNWASGLMAVTWVIHFWWAARAYTSGRIGPIPAVLFGGLAATVGNPYAVLGILAVLLGLAVETLVQRRYRRLLGLVVAGACVGLIIVFVYVPLFGVMTQIDRPYGGTFANSNYLAPSLGDLLGLSSPSYLPRMDAWLANNEVVPSTYLSWLILPLLPWIKWRSFGEWKSRLGLIVSSIVFLLFCLGPDSVWLFRWPIRLIEYSYVGLAVLFALYISRGLANDFRRRRLFLTGLSILIIFFVAWSAAPHLWKTHALLAVIIAALSALTLLAYRRFSLRGVLVVAIVGTAIIAPMQGARFGWNYQQVAPDVDLSVPTTLQTVRDASADFEGTVLQVANIYRVVGTDAVLKGEINFGNTLAASGQSSVVRYTGINFPKFSWPLYMDYRGSFGDEFELKELFKPASRTHDASLVDALGIDTLVISTARLDFDQLDRLSEGWHAVEESENRTVLLRDEPLPHPVVTSDAGTEISANTDLPDNGLRFDYSADSDADVLLGRLAWNGYTATVDGEEIPIRTGAYGLIELDLPAGSGTVELSYRVPGINAAFAALALGLFAALAHGIWWRFSWLRRRESWSPEFVDPAEITSNYVI